MTKNISKKPKKTPQYITERIKIDKFIPGGQTIATLADGKKAMLWNALPGEIVTEIQITKNKSHYLEGIATKIEQNSSHRIDPRDACYLSTSPWQILDHQYELDQKRELLTEIFHQHQISTETPISPVQTDNQEFYYRNKMEYALYFDHELQRILLAFHARGSHRKIPIQQSSLEHPAIWRKANAIIDDLNRHGEEARKYQSLLLRTNQQGKVSGGLFENHHPHPQFPMLRDTILDFTYSYSPNGFFQINLPVYEMALREIQRWIKTDQVLDLYAGVGTIGLSTARDRSLILVECDHAAYRELERNCTEISRQNPNHNSIQPILAKSEEALEYITPEQTIIFDPPRAGCQPQLLDKILSILPPTLIYLSCNPVTQARDVKILSTKYQIKQVTPFNFFPRTPHLENLIILERII